MAIIIPRPLSRRTLLRGAGVCVALPFLEAMRPRRATAQELSPQRFVVWFMPNGTDPGRFFPTEAGALTEASLTECLQDWKAPGFAAEGEWEASSNAVWQDMTLVKNLDHQLVCEKEIHNPAMALSAHTAGGATPEIPPSPTLDQYLADRIQGDTPYRSLTLYATGDTSITQGFLSFRENGQTESVYRDPVEVFDMLFGAGDVGAEGTPDLARQRRQSILDWVGEQATSLNTRLGTADRQRVDQYLQSVFELEQQLASTTGASCTTPVAPEGRPDLHTRIKQFRDLAIVALQCDLTRVVALQYSNSWDVNFGKYALSDGVGDWSDHFLSHKLDDQDRATDLDGLAREEAMAIANARVVQTSRFKMRRFANLVNALRAAPTASGTLLDESLVMFASENGDGDSHSRVNIPIVLAGGVGGFQGARVVDAGRQPTGALHASILNYFGIETTVYGNPEAGPIAGL